MHLFRHPNELAQRILIEEPPDLFTCIYIQVCNTDDEGCTRPCMTTANDFEELYRTAKVSTRVDIVLCGTTICCVDIRYIGDHRCGATIIELDPMLDQILYPNETSSSAIIHRRISGTVDLHDRSWMRGVASC